MLIKTDSKSSDSKWKPMDPAGFSLEAELQQLLWTDSAELTPADSSLEEAHVVYAREVFTASGPIDLVGIGSSGSVTIMECKLARNQQIKREVVGQVLDYAASLWETDITSLSASIARSVGRDPFELLREQFGTDDASFDEEQCRAEVMRRLRDGDFRLLVAVDEIDAQLRRIIQYVNRRGGPQGGLKLVALAFPRFESGSIQVLDPETYGDELADANKSPRVLTDVQQLHLEYWTGFRPYLEERGSQVLLNTPKNSTASSRVTPNGFGFRAWNHMNDGWSGIEASPKGLDAVARFVLVDRELVNERLSRIGEVRWHVQPEPPFVWVLRDGKREGMPSDKDEWPKLMQWMADALDELSSLFGSTDQRDGTGRNA